MRTTNYIAGGIQLTMCVFLLVWFVLLLMSDVTPLSFVVGEYNGRLHSPQLSR
jgi:hypothetical protein